MAGGGELLACSGIGKRRRRRGRRTSWRERATAPLHANQYTAIPLLQETPTDVAIKVPLVNDMVSVLQAEAARNLKQAVESKTSGGLAASAKW